MEGGRERKEERGEEIHVREVVENEGNGNMEKERETERERSMSATIKNRNPL